MESRYAVLGRNQFTGLPGEKLKMLLVMTSFDTKLQQLFDQLSSNDHQ